MDGTLILLVVLLIIAIILLIVALRAGASSRAARRAAGVDAERTAGPERGGMEQGPRNSTGGRENATPALAAPPAGASGVAPSASTAVGPVGESDQQGQQGEHGEQGQQRDGDNAPAATPVAPEGAVPDPARVQMPPAGLATTPSSMGASGLGAPPAMAGQPIASREANPPDDTRPAPGADGESATATMQTVQDETTQGEGAPAAQTAREGTRTAREEEPPDAAAFTASGPSEAPGASRPAQSEAARQDGRAADADGLRDAAAGELVPQPATRSGEIRLAATPGRLPYRLAELIGEQRQLEEAISLVHRRLDEIELGHDAGSSENRVRLGILRQDLSQKQERLREILYLQDGYYWLQQQMAPALEDARRDSR